MTNKRAGESGVLIRKCLQSHACLLYSTAIYIAWGKVCAECGCSGCYTVTLGGRLPSFPYRHDDDAVLQPVPARCLKAQGMCVRRR